MNIILKHTLKNIFGKPFRSLILIVCVTVTCLTAFLTLDMSGGIQDIFTSYIANMLGNLDMEINSSREIDPAILKELPENYAVGMEASSYAVATRDPEQYSYEYVKDLLIYGLDTEPAFRMGMFPEELTLADDETAISETYAKTFGIAVGDVIDLYDEKGNTHAFRVTRILKESGVFIKENGYTAVVNEEAMKMITGKDKLQYYFFMIDIVDDKQVNEAYAYLKENYPDFTVTLVKGNETMQEAINQMVGIFAVLFVVTFLMVIFVTVSLSEKIVNERMAVIGTLLSLGISRGVTTAILLLENVMYGLIGFLLAAPLYGAIRESLFQGMISVEGGMSVQPMQKWIYVVVFCGAIAVECFTPAKELRKAVKVSIRDIIFSNKDTDYVFSKRRTTLGLVLAVIGILFAFMKNAAILIVSLIFLVVGIALLIPMCVRYLSGWLVKLFAKLELPVAELSAREMGSKKNTISNCVLCLAISALAVTMFAVGNGLSDITTHQSYQADVLIFGGDTERERYSYIKDLDGVREVLFFESYMDYLTINGEKSAIPYDVLALPQSELFVGISGLPEELNKNEILVSQSEAVKRGWKVGDEIEITFKPDGVFPIRKTLKLAGTADTALYESVSVVLIAPELYRDIFHESFSMILIGCEDPTYVSEMIQKHSLDLTGEFYTAEEYRQELKKTESGIMSAIYIATGFGILLSVIGLSGNQVIGFEARRREYAMLYSTSMNQKQLKRLIFLETLFSMGCSITLGSIVGVILSAIVKKAAYAMTLPLGIDLHLGQFFGILAALIAILVLCSLKPLKLLKKMKISEELKYE